MAARNAGSSSASRELSARRRPDGMSRSSTQPPRCSSARTPSAAARIAAAGNRPRKKRYPSSPRQRRSASGSPWNGLESASSSTPPTQVAARGRPPRPPCGGMISAQIMPSTGRAVMAEAPAGRERPAAARVERPGSATRGERPRPAVGHSEPAPVQAEQDAGHAGQDAGQTPVPAEGERPEPPVRRHRRGAGIYGTIITAAVLAAAGPTESVADVAVTVLVTLLVYWIAEQYSDLLGEQLHGGHLPSWRAVGAALATTWSMVSA